MQLKCIKGRFPWDQALFGRASEYCSLPCIYEWLCCQGWSRSLSQPLLGVEGPPAITVHTVDAAHGIRPWHDIIQVRRGAVDACAGVEVRIEVLPAHGVSGGQVYIRVLWLVYLGSVGEEDLWLWAANGNKQSLLVMEVFLMTQIISNIVSGSQTAVKYYPSQPSSMKNIINSCLIIIWTIQLVKRQGIHTEVRLTIG